MIGVVLALLAQEGLIYGTADLDAGPIYLGLAKDLPEVPEALSDYAVGDPADPAVVAEALKAFEPALRRVREAVGARRCTWSYPGRERFSGDIPHVSAMVGLSKALSARTRLAIEAGRTDDAVEDALAAWRLGLELASDGPLIGRLLGMIVLALENGALQRALPSRALSAVQLTRLAIHVEWVYSRFPSIERFVEGEKAVILGSVDDAIEDFLGLAATVEGIGKKTAAPKRREFGEAYWKSLQKALQEDRDASRKALRARIEELWKDVLLDVALPLGQEVVRFDRDKMKARGMERWKAFEASGERADGVAAAAELYALLMLPAVTTVRKNVAVARLAVGLHALRFRLELHRLAHGAYPNSLEGFRPAIADPWSGKTLVYRRLEVGGRIGFVLTASGPKNDGEARIDRFKGVDFDLDRYGALGPEAENSTGWFAWQLLRP